jgi:catechol 2,3-dioxygenase-like lactoylglutathione lyase family enzyme
MSDADRPHDDDRRLIDDLLDGCFGSCFEDGLGRAPAAAEDLLARLESDPSAREYLVERAVLHAGLRQSLSRRSLSDWAVSQSEEDAVPRSRRARRPVLAWLAASACLAAVVIGGLISNRPYATVTVGIGTAGLDTGRKVRGESYELAAGVLELETGRGAQIVIEAPASFRFESSQRLRLTKGRIAAEVPPRAKGFTVVTPSGEAIDLGTRFAVDVPASGAAEVHVFSGEVVARATAKTPTSLRDGEAFSLAANASRELRTAAFIRSGEVAELAAAVTAGQERHAQEASDRLHEDPALIAAIDFEADDHAGQYRVVQGRWPGSRAADFTNVGDHLSLTVGGDADWPQLTVAAWVRLDRLGELYQSLYHTDGWSKENPGQVHWMIVNSGVMRLALPGWRLGAGAIERHEHPESRTPVLGTEGRWMHLAFVYDSEARTASFFVDGRPDGVTELEFAPPARLGPARVGNWNDRDRTLSGRIDELVFVGRVLSADEIRSLYESGVPYR